MISMDSPLLTLVIALFFGFFVLIVESQGNLNPRPPGFTPPPPSPPPPPPSPAPPPPPPPPESPPPPPPQRSPPPPPLSPPPPPRRDHRHPPPNHGYHKKHRPPPKKEKLNPGKKVGLMFIGVATILQVCVVTFLLIRRRQLFEGENVY